MSSFVSGLGKYAWSMAVEQQQLVYLGFIGWAYIQKVTKKRLSRVEETIL